MMVKMDKTPSELIEYLYSKVGPHYYRRDDILYDPIIEESIKEKLNDKNIPLFKLWEASMNGEIKIL